ncbi:hypothetical protein [Rhodomicrobium lacus]|uniref:hypothetical protein n=1 Tax=Rhodomicrobium lacus TaxID=2498452 RepID=UPI0026E4009C|nr:hypothetical protein [Rhodomicrobium lacus]WKW50386.1 hypothetical protein QMO75_14030 [Rhodomicrobium lacus]
MLELGLECGFDYSACCERTLVENGAKRRSIRARILAPFFQPLNCEKETESQSLLSCFYTWTTPMWTPSRRIGRSARNRGLPWLIMLYLGVRRSDAVRMGRTQPSEPLLSFATFSGGLVDEIVRQCPGEQARELLKAEIRRFRQIGFSRSLLGPQRPGSW